MAVRGVTLGLLLAALPIAGAPAAGEEIGPTSIRLAWLDVIGATVTQRSRCRRIDSLP